MVVSVCSQYWQWNATFHLEDSYAYLNLSEEYRSEMIRILSLDALKVETQSFQKMTNKLLNTNEYQFRKNTKYLYVYLYICSIFICIPAYTLHNIFL